jgi:hypothetical protein
MSEISPECVKRTGFSLAGRKTRGICRIARTACALRFASSTQAPRYAQIFRHLQIVGKQYRLCDGEGGIRTLGTGYPVRQISNLVPSTTRPPLRGSNVSPGS